MLIIMKSLGLQTDFVISDNLLKAGSVCSKYKAVHAFFSLNEDYLRVCWLVMRAENTVKTIFLKAAYI